jgi:hypothetical protein
VRGEGGEEGRGEKGKGGKGREEKGRRGREREGEGRREWEGKRKKEREGEGEGGEKGEGGALTLPMSGMLPVSDRQLEPHVPDHVIAKTGSQSNPVLKGIHSHG